MESNQNISVEFTPEFQAYTHSENHVGDSLVTVKQSAIEYQNGKKGQSRMPVNIVAVLDKSGSMRGRKIEMVRQTLGFIIDERKPQHSAL